MRRKVVKHGPSSLTISLPIKWARENHLNRGDELDLTESGTDLLISGKGKRQLREITISFNKKNKIFLKRLFKMPYLRGYDIINIGYDCYEILEDIQKTIGDLQGFEILKQSATCCVLKNVAEPKLEEFEAMLLRMFNICTTLFEELNLFVEKDDEEALKRIILLEKTMTRLDLFCRRMINIEGIGIKHPGSAYAIVRGLEEIGDIVRDIALQKPIVCKKHKKYLLEMVHLIVESFSLLKRARYKGDLEPIYLYKKMKNKLRKSLEPKKEFEFNELTFFFSLKQLVYKLHDLSEEIVLWLPLEKLSKSNGTKKQKP